MGKLSDFFIGVIEFFGILIPGTLIIFLHGKMLLQPMQEHLGNLIFLSTIESSKDWILISVFAYLAGHLLFALSELIYNFLIKYKPHYFLFEETKMYGDKANNYIQLPIKNKSYCTEIYYYSFSFIRVTSQEAISEIEHKASEYKMFRSLSILFLLDILLSALSLNLTISHLIFSLSLSAFSFFRFRMLLNWTYKLTFQFFIMLKQKGV